MDRRGSILAQSTWVFLNKIQMFVLCTNVVDYYDLDLLVFKLRSN